MSALKNQVWRIYELPKLQRRPSVGLVFPVNIYTLDLNKKCFCLISTFRLRKEQLFLKMAKDR